MPWKLISENLVFQKCGHPEKSFWSQRISSIQTFPDKTFHILRLNQRRVRRYPGGVMLFKQKLIIVEKLARLAYFLLFTSTDVFNLISNSLTVL